MCDEVVNRGLYVMVIISIMRVSVRMRLGARMPLVATGGSAEVKGAMGNDACAGLFVNLHGPAEMIRVRVGNEDGVDMTRLKTGKL
jgi:hypothetical protein